MGRAPNVSPDDRQVCTSLVGWRLVWSSAIRVGPGASCSCHSEMNLTVFLLCNAQRRWDPTGSMDAERHTEYRFQGYERRSRNAGFFGRPLRAALPVALPVELGEGSGSISILAASPLEQAPNRDLEKIMKNAPQAPKDGEEQSAQDGFARHFSARRQALPYLNHKCTRHGGEIDPTNKEERHDEKPPQERNPRLRK
jgi:hypothetical protein